MSKRGCLAVSGWGQGHMSVAGSILTLKFSSILHQVGWFLIKFQHLWIFLTLSGSFSWKYGYRSSSLNRVNNILP